MGDRKGGSVVCTPEEAVLGFSKVLARKGIDLDENDVAAITEIFCIYLKSVGEFHYDDPEAHLPMIQRAFDKFYRKQKRKSRQKEHRPRSHGDSHHQQNHKYPCCSHCCQAPSNRPTPSSIAFSESVTVSGSEETDTYTDSCDVRELFSSPDYYRKSLEEDVASRNVLELLEESERALEEVFGSQDMNFLRQKYLRDSETPSTDVTMSLTSESDGDSLSIRRTPACSKIFQVYSRTGDDDSSSSRRSAETDSSLRIKLSMLADGGGGDFISVRRTNDVNKELLQNAGQHGVDGRRQQEDKTGRNMPAALVNGQISWKVPSMTDRSAI